MLLELHGAVHRGECVNRKVSLDAVVFLNRGKINEVYPVFTYSGHGKNTAAYYCS